MKTIALETCDASVRELIERVRRGSPVILTENNVPRYVLGAMDEFEWEVLSLSHNQEFMAYLESARVRGQTEGSLPMAEMRRRLSTSSTLPDLVPTQAKHTTP